LMNEGLSLATTLLEKNGEFFPFAIVMHPLGEVVHFNVYDGREHPPSREVRELLFRQLRLQAEDGQCKAIAVFSNMAVQDRDSGSKFDAVAAELEHQSGYSVAVYIPYTASDSSVVLGDPRASKREPTVFSLEPS